MAQKHFDARSLVKYVRTHRAHKANWGNDKKQKCSTTTDIDWLPNPQSAIFSGHTFKETCKEKRTDAQMHAQTDLQSKPWNQHGCVKTAQEERYGLNIKDKQCQRQS